MKTLSPTQKATMAQKYTAKSLENKVKNKTELQKELGWPEEPKRPMLCLPAGMTDELGGALLKEILPGLLSLPLEILVLGNGSAEYGEFFTQLAKEQGHRVHIVPNKSKERSKMFAAADIALFCSDPSDLPQLRECLEYGVVPIAPTTKKLENYDPVQESGNAFLYEEPTVWHCFTAIVRAVETRRFPFDWRTIQRHCMDSIK